ncbi:SDR family NAD(P)-dependent oxidoreductase [Roseomonas sp. NAR14]|uniref:SDR family NAD(P)-dependent oxidoreductase n=1 Tax=Roseomonas acroporae TaxID=2937791 RepID=A0A9X2BT79_9PROT|nr:SDR family NAD(P)-dependent oxidoreductase [Roseomonas acroporae]
MSGDEWALVTGAGSGIGLAIAQALAARGTRLILVGRRPEVLHRAAASLPVEAMTVAADVATDAGIDAVSAALPASLGILVHSAGMFHHGPVAATTPGTWDRLFGVNVRGPLALTAACLPQLRRARGQVVFVNSTAGLGGSPGNGAYAATKQALRAAADVLRQEIAAEGIRVLSVYPGRTDTPMQVQVLQAENRPGGDVALLRPEYVADVVMAALSLPADAELGDLVIRPRRPGPP